MASSGMAFFASPLRTLPPTNTFDDDDDDDDVTMGGSLPPTGRPTSPMSTTTHPSSLLGKPLIQSTSVGPCAACSTFPLLADPCTPCLPTAPPLLLIQLNPFSRNPPCEPLRLPSAPFFPFRPSTGASFAWGGGDEGAGLGGADMDDSVKRWLVIAVGASCVGVLSAVSSPPSSRHSHAPPGTLSMKLTLSSKRTRSDVPSSPLIRLLFSLTCCLSTVSLRLPDLLFPASRSSPEKPERGLEGGSVEDPSSAPPPPSGCLCPHAPPQGCTHHQSTGHPHTHRGLLTTLHSPT